MKTMKFSLEKQHVEGNLSCSLLCCFLKGVEASEIHRSLHSLSPTSGCPALTLAVSVWYSKQLKSVAKPLKQVRKSSDIVTLSNRGGRKNVRENPSLFCFWIWLLWFNRRRKWWCKKDYYPIMWQNTRELPKLPGVKFFTGHYCKTAVTQSMSNLNGRW